MQTYTKEELIAYENYIKNLFELGYINTPVHLSGGNEDILIDIFKEIKYNDYVFSTHRNHYHYLLKGGCPWKLTEEILGQRTGICKGKGRSMHIYDPSINFYTSAIVGGICAIAVGVGMGIKKKARGKNNVAHVWCFIGDGAEDTGHFLESARYAYSMSLPVTFIIEDNDLAVETSKKERWGDKYSPVRARNIRRYCYKRKYPHVGVGKHVSM